MARRIYEEDSFTEDFEEAPLQRTWRLRGGLEPTEAKGKSRRSVAELRVNSDDPARSFSAARAALTAKLSAHAPGNSIRAPLRVYAGDPESATASCKTARAAIDAEWSAAAAAQSAKAPSFARTHSVTKGRSAARGTPGVTLHGGASVEEEGPREDRSVRYSTNESRILEKVDFMKYLCFDQHEFTSQKRYDLPSKSHNCRVCEKGRFETKEQCTVCNAGIHYQCLDMAPLPCIWATPISNLDKIDLRDCTGGFGVKIKKVPAILIKLFHELQKVDRIKEPHMYRPLPQCKSDEAKIDMWTARLCRSATRHLLYVATPILAGCVLKFLVKIQSDLILPDELKKVLEAKHESLRDTKIISAQRKDALELALSPMLFKLAPARRQTLATIMLHLHTIMAQSQYNLMTPDVVLNIFEPIVPLMDIFFIPDDAFWLTQLTTD